jgi:hypothetical protein
LERRKQALHERRLSLEQDVKNFSLKLSVFINLVSPLLILMSKESSSDLMKNTYLGVKITRAAAS